MRIIADFPPNIAEILKVFPLANGGSTIFAYAPDIYAPSGRDLPPELLEHESIHIERQLIMGVEAWWAQYLTDPAFVYEEELLAHRAEYKKLCEMFPNRNSRRSALKHVARKLSASLYGKMITLAKAAEALEAP